ncbi:Kinesin-1-like protein PSS1 [Heracleum sosnowskyi]|uniref:Kinesin-like protein n=1 Tax=Heracleum sosnowskyi TaxID=360622 RepID=A0AAD8HQP7_9APIA|nr:Kinesin-1-like protein PSS1 [Heracleum sosnowskyi]
MSNVTVCARFRPLSSREADSDDLCVQGLDAENFILKDEKDEELKFSFDRVFYPESEQAEVFEFVALPIIKDVFNAVNGTIITYGQTGAGKTYSMEGPGIANCDEQNKGLVPRVIEELFETIRASDEAIKSTITLSMVEIYMERIRDLFDLSKDNIQIKEHKVLGIILQGVTEITLVNPEEALESLSNGISSRAVGETQMNMASSRSHCVYVFTVKQEVTMDKRIKYGKLILVDLAGSEKVEKTGAEGRVLEEAKNINKSLSALGNVVNAMTGPLGKGSHIPYRDSKLTRVLQNALGGNCRTALLCCCSPSPRNVSESLSTLRFGARARHIKASPHVNLKEEKSIKKHEAHFLTKDDLHERILLKFRENLDVEDMKFLEEAFVLAGVKDLDLAYEDVLFRTISSLHEALEEVVTTVSQLKRENNELKSSLVAAHKEMSHKKSFMFWPL